MKGLFILSLALLFLQVSPQTCAFGQSQLCGRDLKTYPNICALLTARVQILSSGPCPATSYNQCYQSYQPVCGKDSVTYLNECTLAANNVSKAYEGPCGEEPFKQTDMLLICNCSGQSFMPVCGINGYTFENKCLMECLGQLSVSTGPCLTPCDCD